MGLWETDLSGFSIEWREIYPKDTGKMTSRIHTNTEHVDKKSSTPYLVAQKAPNFRGIWVDCKDHNKDCWKLRYEVNSNAGTRLACVISGFFMLVKSHPQIWLDGWRWSVLRRRGWRVCRSAKFHQDVMPWPNEGQFDVLRLWFLFRNVHSKSISSHVSCGLFLFLWGYTHFEARVIPRSRARVYECRS